MRLEECEYLFLFNCIKNPVAIKIFNVYFLPIDTSIIAKAGGHDTMCSCIKNNGNAYFKNVLPGGC